MLKLTPFGLTIALSAVLTACSAGGLFTGGADRASTSQASAGQSTIVAAPSIDTESLALYLEVMRRLVAGDLVTQAETFREVAEDARLAPTTTNRLKLAFALATPGHASSDASEAARQLSGLIVAGDILLPEERVLATIHLKDVEQRLILDAAAEQLRREAEVALARQSTESEQQLRAALAENRRLRAELEDATQKLNAIMTIEQSIRARGNDAVSQ